MASTQTRLNKLNDQRNQLEEDIKAYGEVLQSNSNVGMNGSLVDEELYPRNDIDVYAVRQSRQKIICLQNDHKALMKEIEYLLEQLHKEKMEPRKIETAVKKMKLNVEESGDAFAVVGVVDEGSPAQTAGLHEGDRICKFGSLNSNNFKSLHDIAKIVQSNEGQVTCVVLQRGSETLTLEVVTSPWRGSGLLGCKVLPVKK